METEAMKLQINTVQLQIDLQESNYKYAVELHQDYDTLRRMRDNIRGLKETLQSLHETNKENGEDTED